MKELIAIGAAVGANCKQCLRYHVRMAVESGADEQEIMETIQIAKMVRMVITPGLVQEQGNSDLASGGDSRDNRSAAGST